MNIIQKQAKEFVQREMLEDEGYQKFMNSFRAELLEYRKVIYRIEFVECVIQKVKIEFDNHFKECKKPQSCFQIEFYENALFFLQEELENLETQISPVDFNMSERQVLNQALQQIINDLNLLKLGQELTYNDLSAEFEELKDLYFLNKKNWLQLFNGKLTEMIAGGIISETVSRQIVKVLSEHYESLIIN